MNMTEVGLCEDFNFPIRSISPSDRGAVEEISIPGFERSAEVLKIKPYQETYDTLYLNRAYNMRLIDGALVQFRYRFYHDKLIKHTLSFFPSSNLLEYQSDPEVYGTDVLYAEAIMENAVTVPIRFDYDEEAAQDFIHPASHFTLGQYKNCRIPVIGALTPYRFLSFVLRAFYNSSYRMHCSDWCASVPDFVPTITDRERSDLHLSFG